MQYKNVESLEMPSEIDKTSSPDGIYVRRNIKKVETENGFKYCYQETFLSFDEYESYSKKLLANHINDEDNTKEYEEYKKKLDTGVLYSNGKCYKPKWYKLYANILKDFKDIYMLVDEERPLTLTAKIYDITGKSENAEDMTLSEIVDLWYFLYEKKEEFYEQYKKSL